MSAKFVTVLAVLFSFSMIFFCSCSEEYVVGATNEKTHDSNIQQFEKVKGELDTFNERIYLIALDGEGDIISFNVYDSIYELDFSLSIQQIEMIEAYDVAVIADHVVISEIVTGWSAGESLSVEDITALLVISSHDIDNVSWHCIKVCAGSDNEEKCILACMGKRPGQE